MAPRMAGKLSTEHWILTLKCLKVVIFVLLTIIFLFQVGKAYQKLNIVRTGTAIKYINRNEYTPELKIEVIDDQVGNITHYPSPTEFWDRVSSDNWCNVSYLDINYGLASMLFPMDIRSPDMLGRFNIESLSSVYQERVSELSFGMNQQSSRRSIHAKPFWKVAPSLNPQASVRMNLEPADKVYTKLGGPGQFVQGIDKRFGTSVIILDGGRDRGLAKMVQVTETRRHKLNTEDSPCDESNASDMQVCYDAWMEKELRCRLPWIQREDPDRPSRVCDQAEDTTKFINIQIQITDFSFNEQEFIKLTGCLPRCLSSTYTFDVLFETQLSAVLNPSLLDHPNGTWLLFIYSQQNIRLEEELQSYTFTSFLAEFGSYLGLLLGFGVLQIGDMLIATYQHICRLHKRGSLSETLQKALFSS